MHRRIEAEREAYEAALDKMFEAERLLKIARYQFQKSRSLKRNLAVAVASEAHEKACVAAHRAKKHLCHAKRRSRDRAVRMADQAERWKAPTFFDVGLISA
jgi:hypothetical protein